MPVNFMAELPSQKSGSGALPTYKETTQLYTPGQNINARVQDTAGIVSQGINQYSQAAINEAKAWANLTGTVATSADKLVTSYHDYCWSKSRELLDEAIVQGSDATSGENGTFNAKGDQAQFIPVNTQEALTKIKQDVFKKFGYDENSLVGRMFNAAWRRQEYAFINKGQQLKTKEYGAWQDKQDNTHINLMIQQAYNNYADMNAVMASLDDATISARKIFERAGYTGETLSTAMRSKSSEWWTQVMGMAAAKNDLPAFEKLFNEGMAKRTDSSGNEYTLLDPKSMESMKTKWAGMNLDEFMVKLKQKDLPGAMSIMRKYMGVPEMSQKSNEKQSSLNAPEGYSPIVAIPAANETTFRSNNVESDPVTHKTEIGSLCYFEPKDFLPNGKANKWFKAAGLTDFMKGLAAEVGGEDKLGNEAVWAKGGAARAYWERYATGKDFIERECQVYEHFVLGGGLDKYKKQYPQACEAIKNNQALHGVALSTFIQWGEQSVKKALFDTYDPDPVKWNEKIRDAKKAICDDPEHAAKGMNKPAYKNRFDREYADTARALGEDPKTWKPGSNLPVDPGTQAKMLGAIDAYNKAKKAEDLETAQLLEAQGKVEIMTGNTQPTLEAASLYGKMGNFSKKFELETAAKASEGEREANTLSPNMTLSQIAERASYYDKWIQDNPNAPTEQKAEMLTKRQGWDKAHALRVAAMKDPGAMGMTSIDVKSLGENATPQQVAEASRLYQERVGVPANDIRYLSKEQMDKLQGQLFAHQGDLTNYMAEMRQAYGPAIWNKILQDGVTDKKIDPTFLSMEGLNKDVAQGIVEMSKPGMIKATHDGCLDFKATGAETAFKQTLVNHFQPLMTACTLGGRPDLAASLYNCMEKAAYFYIASGLKPNEAAKRAYQSVIDDRFVVGDTYFYEKTYYNKAGQLCQRDSDAVNRALKQGMDIPADQLNVNDLRVPGMSDDAKAKLYSSSVRSNGKWVPYKDGFALALVQNGIHPRLVTGKDGNPIIMTTEEAEKKGSNLSLYLDNEEEQ